MAKRFGTVEKLSSGKYRARFKHPLTGERVSAPVTYTRKGEANNWLSQQQIAIEQGTWRDRRIVNTTLDTYGLECFKSRGLKPEVYDNYLGVWNYHVSPYIGSVRIQDLTPERVRAWRTARLEAGSGQSAVAFAYRILKSVCEQALSEQVITFQPCQIKGASQVKPERRTPLSVEQVFELANEVAPRYKALVLFLAFTGLRVGEATALTTSDLKLDNDNPHVVVSRRVRAKQGGSFSFAPPKTQAGNRTVQLSKALIPVLIEHINEFVSDEQSDYLFPTKLGNPAVTAGAKEISKAYRRLGLATAHTHDLRHTSATLIIELGIPTQHLQARLGHADAQSTAIYVQTTEQADKVIADKLDDLFIAKAKNVIPIRRVS